MSKAPLDYNAIQLSVNEPLCITSFQEAHRAVNRFFRYEENIANQSFYLISVDQRHKTKLLILLLGKKSVQMGLLLRTQVKQICMQIF